MLSVDSPILSDAREPHDHSSIREYHPQLDSLRAIAVLLVMISHWVPEAYLLRLPWGHFGLQLFFVLSGFLITNILLRINEARGKEKSFIVAFFVRRILRICPAYYALLLVLWVTDFDITRATILWHVFYMTNMWIFWNNSFDTWLAHFWSLSVEEQFYLGWPWFVCFRWRIPVKAIAIGLLIVSPIFRFATKVYLTQYESNVLVLCAADSLIAGALLAILHDNTIHETMYRHIRCRIAVPVFLVLQIWIHFQQIPLALETLRHTAMVLAFAGLVSGASRGFQGAFGWICDRPLLQNLGKISYCIYLVHNIVPQWVHMFIAKMGQTQTWYLESAIPLRFLVHLFITISIAWLSWICIERPCSRLKKHFPYPSIRSLR